MYYFLKREAFLLNSFLFSKRFCFYILYVRECVACCVFFQHMHVCVHGVQGGQKVPDPLGRELHSCELPHGCWEPTPSPVQDQKVLLTKSSLRPLLKISFYYLCVHGAYGAWKTVEPLKLELQVTESHPMWLLGSNSGLLIEYKCF